MIKKQLYPHFTKLRRHLNNSEIEEYKNLTIRRSIYSVLSNEPIKVIKKTEDVLVLDYKDRIIKVVFQPCWIYEGELFFSHILYDSKLETYATTKSCMLILPKYGKNLRDANPDAQSMKNVQSSLIREIVNLHNKNIVHHDVKPSNIVSTQDGWRLIDFGLTETHRIEDKYHCSFSKGTKKVNVPNFAISDDDCHRCFWTFMKDWYGFSKTLSMYGIDDDLCHLIDNMKKKEIEETLCEYLNEENIETIPFYLRNQSKRIRTNHE